MLAFPSDTSIWSALPCTSWASCYHRY